MSPASYRAAPPRVGSSTLPSGPGTRQIGPARRTAHPDGSLRRRRCSASGWRAGAGQLSAPPPQPSRRRPSVAPAPGRTHRSRRAFRAASLSTMALRASCRAACEVLLRVARAAARGRRGRGRRRRRRRGRVRLPACGRGAAPPPPFLLASLAQTGLSVDPVGRLLKTWSRAQFRSAAYPIRLPKATSTRCSSGYEPGFALRRYTGCTYSRPFASGSVSKFPFCTRDPPLWPPRRMFSWLLTSGLLVKLFCTCPARARWCPWQLQQPQRAVTRPLDPLGAPGVAVDRQEARQDVPCRRAAAARDERRGQRERRRLLVRHLQREVVRRFSPGVVPDVVGRVVGDLPHLAAAEEGRWRLSRGSGSSSSRWTLNRSCG